MRLSLIAPKWPDGSLWGQIYFRFPYLSLTTLASLTGAEWEIAFTGKLTSPSGDWNE